MASHHFFTASRLLIVAGKGGVGKSAVAGALALSCARSGLSTLLVDLEASQNPLPAHERLQRLTISPGRALEDYLLAHRLGLVSRQLARTGLIELVASTAPGIDDLLVLGKIKSLERELSTDIIIVDGPPAGHALELLRAPARLMQAIGGGPIHHQATEVSAMLSDPTRCRVMLVTTPAMTPVSETVEVAFDLEESVGVSLTPVVVNKIDTSPPVLDATTLEHTLRTAYEYACARSQAQSAAISKLRTLLPLRQLHIPRFTSQGEQLIYAMADEIETQLELLS